ncbi:VOC family protein [Bacillus sp. JJ1532]|uniref:VOC family protein n=1 Tax=unclassified Bacillus (in: firmicutes) TaxID=185979 RepID=UPI0030007C03
MQKIIPHLWYDKEAREAALFYISLFEDSKLLNETVIENTPSGDSELVSFELAGQEFMAISAGPYFKFNPSVSLMVACESIEEVNTKWEALVEGGTELMPLGEYPFSKRYAWVQDRFGLSWQLMLKDNGKAVQKITPNLLFSSDSCGKADEAIQYYTDIFEDSKIEVISKYEAGESSSSKAKVKYAAFNLSGYHLSAMDHGYDVDFNFNEAFSLMINCKDQQEIDYFWNKLSAVPEAEQCGWVKDQFGLSWQIVPGNMNEVLYKGSKDENRRVFQALLKMKKIDLNALENARFEK